MRSIFLLRWGTGGPLDGQGALARPGPRMRAAFGLPEPPASVIAALVSDAKQNRLLCQIADPNRMEKRKTAVRAWRSERPKRADSVEKDPLAIAERCSLNTARAPFFSGVSRLLRCGKDLGQFAEVLGGGGEQKFVICAAWAS